MGQKDDVTKEYMQDERRFSDAFNYFLYDGKQVISPENLVEQDTSEMLAFYGTDDKIVSKQNIRDVLKRAVLKKDEQAYYLLLGIENQSDIHYAMPVRNMVYDALNYAAQVSEAAKKHKSGKENGTPAEFLSGFHKGDALTPVITLVIYWEDGEWDGPRSIHDMIKVKDTELLKYISDYRIHIIVPDEVDDFAKFHTELRKVLRFLSVKNEQAGITELIKMCREDYSQVDEDSAKVLHVCAGLQLTHRTVEGGFDVCKGIEDMLKTERIEGRAEERALNKIKENETLVRNVEAIMQNLKLSTEEACNALNITLDAYQDAKAVISK